MLTFIRQKTHPFSDKEDNNSVLVQCNEQNGQKTNFEKKTTVTITHATERKIRDELEVCKKPFCINKIDVTQNLPKPWKHILDASLGE